MASLQVLPEELDSRPECAVFSGLDRRYGQISASGKAVRATCKVHPPVQFRDLFASAEDGIRLS